MKNKKEKKLKVIHIHPEYKNEEERQKTYQEAYLKIYRIFEIHGLLKEEEEEVEESSLEEVGETN